MKRYSILNTIALITVLVCGTLLLIAAANKYILTQEFYDRNGQPLSGIPDFESAVYRQIQQSILLYSAIYLILKLSLISLVLYTGLTFFDVKASFGAILRIVTCSEFIFLIPAGVKIWWFYFHVSGPTLEQWQSYYFLSAASLYPNVAPTNLYALQTLNVFEISYWFLLALGLKFVTGRDFDSSLKFVICSYLPSLILWVVLVVFLAILFVPQSN